MNTGVKRSLFTKPAWAAPAASSSAKIEDDASVFGRNVAYDDIVQAEQAKREKKAAKAKSLHAEKIKSVSPSSAKRRRISVDREDSKEDSTSELDAWTTRARLERISNKSSREQSGRVTRSTPQKEKSLRTGLERSPTRHDYTPRAGRRAASAAESIGLDADDDDDDGELVMLTPGKSKKTGSSTKAKMQPRPSIDDVNEDEDSDEDDEYLRELKRKARERARLQRLGQLDPESAQSPLAAASATPPPPAVPRALSTDHAQSRPVSASSVRGFASRSTATPVSEHEKEEDDPPVKILIHSDMPNTNPLIVKRKASQSLKQVREYWCKRWDLDEAVARKVFFTWRGTRLFDSTTMRGIINKLKKDHWKQSAGWDGNEQDEDGSGDHDPSQGNIMLEAMTPEIYEEKLRQKELQLNKDQNLRSADEDDPDSSEEAPASHARANDRDAASGAIVIRLVSKTIEPMQLRVRPHTTVGKIMRGYATTKKLDDGMTPWLMFDGDPLDPEATVQDIGLEDEDEIEVRIRPRSE